MKNHNLLKFAANLLLVGLFCLQLACTSSGNKEVTSEEDAYNDFKNYVTRVETTTDSQIDTTQTDWATASANARAEYDAKVAKLDQYEYDETQKQEIENLKTRYNTYWSQREADFQTRVGTGTVTGIAGAGSTATDFRSDAIATTPAADIRVAYENFVERVRTNKDNYTKEQWQSAENYFKALDDRKEAVESQLTDKDKYEIGKAKTKYTTLKAGRLGIDASEAGNEVVDAAESGAKKAGNTAENVGSEVKDAAKTGAKAVGNTAEKIGSGIKSTVKKGAKKVDEKIDDNPNED